MVSDATELLLVRHGVPLSRAHADPPLSEKGWEQSRMVATWLADEPIDRLYTSPLLRARQTAEPLEALLGQHAIVVEDLREWEPERAADWTYTVVEELDARHPRAIALATGRYEEFVPPMDLHAFSTRSRSVIERLLVDGGRRVVAITHGETIAAGLGALIGSNQVFWFYPEYTSISRVRGLPDRPVICSVNEVPHLEIARRAGRRDAGGSR